VQRHHTENRDDVLPAEEYANADRDVRLLQNHFV
jgi:hypothetical protein